MLIIIDVEGEIAGSRATTGEDASCSWGATCDRSGSSSGLMAISSSDSVRSIMAVSFVDAAVASSGSCPWFSIEGDGTVASRSLIHECRYACCKRR